MADDFDDDLFNAYNEASDHKPMDNSHEFEDEFADALDTTKEDHTQDERQSPPPPPPQRQQNYNNYTNQQRYYQQNQQQQQQQTVMMNGVPMPYQMALAYQQQMQQMLANPLQFQMYQQQYRQMQQQQQQRRTFQQRPPQPEDKEALERKMFIGGLDWDTTDEGLKEHFGQFGPVASCSVMRDVATGQSRGFAFLSMVEAADVDKVLAQAEHYVDGKKIDPKRAVSRAEQPAPVQDIPLEKIFVGGISSAVDRDDFKAFFEQFGTVADATLMMDRQTGRPRGFGFITFEEAGAVDRALAASDLVIKDKQVEIKRATPKTARPTRPNTRYAGAAHGAHGGGGFKMYQPLDDDDRRRHHRHDRSGGGAVHASSSSRSQYRPY